MDNGGSFWPNSRWQQGLLGLTGLLGVLVGLGLFTFNFAEGLSYLSDDPEACVNCHIMRQQYDGWNRASHHDVASCNDCHTPHRFPDKYVVKAVNGWNHSVAFTTGNFPNTIRIRAFNAEVTQDNCVECHETMVSNLHEPGSGATPACVTCHADVGHSP